MKKSNKIIFVLIFFSMFFCGLFVGYILSEYKHEKYMNGILGNEISFNCLTGLRVIQENKKQFKPLLDSGLDVGSIMLAKFVINNPNKTPRRYYNLLMSIKKYREKNNRIYDYPLPERFKKYSSTEIDELIRKALQEYSSGARGVGEQRVPNDNKH